jgi:hypothetical protein
MPLNSFELDSFGEEGRLPEAVLLQATFRFLLGVYEITEIRE